ncbi:MAG: hypothetical protein AB7V40_05880 [Methyloceanibacter sp.]
MRLALSLLAAAALLASGSLSLAAEDEPARSATEPAAPPSASPASPAEAGRQLTPEEKAEKEARKACKKTICDIIATRDPNGDNVSCDIVKTWREEDIVKMLGGKISWPWGKAVCQSKLDLERKSLALAMSEASREIVMPMQKVSCTLAQKKEGEPYTVEVTLAPKVKFENGKAVEASINWGEATAPLLIYPLIYAGTGLDNKTNVLGPEVVRMVNEFVTKKCAELKVEGEGGQKTASP